MFLNFNENHKKTFFTSTGDDDVDDVGDATVDVGSDRRGQPSDRRVAAAAWCRLR